MRSAGFVSAAAGLAFVLSCAPALAQTARIDGGVVNREAFTVMTPLVEQALLGNDPGAWSPVPTPGWEFAPPRLVRLGDVFAVDLLVNPGTGQKIVDYLSVQERTPNVRGFSLVPPREFAFTPGPPRDFRAEDAELRVREPRLTINGQVEQSTIDHPGEAAGKVIWFYAGERGRFMLSLVPRPERRRRDVRSELGDPHRGPGTVQPVRAPRPGVATDLCECRSVCVHHRRQRRSGTADRWLG